MARNKIRILFRFGAVAVLSMALSSCASVGFKIINTPSYLGNDHAVRKSLSYGAQSYQKLDLYVPDQSVAQNNTLIVFVYGGGWTSGVKEQYYFAADAFTSAGYTVAIPDYIKYPEGRFPVFVEDIALAIAWLEDNITRTLGIENMVLMGHSAGAHIGALLITDPSYLAAHDLQPQIIDRFVGLAGPYGFTPKKRKYRNIFNNMENYQPMQPLHFADGDEPQMLLLHGDDDGTVVVENTQRMAQKVNAAGGVADTKIYSGFGHIGMLLSLSKVYDFKGAVREDIVRFLGDTKSYQAAN